MPRYIKWFVAVTAALVVSLLIFTGGVMLGSYSSQIDESEFTAIEGAWRVITEEYVDKDNIDKQALSQAAIEAMMSFIDDPYSSYLDREAYLESANDLAGKYEGVGAEVSIVDDGVVIISVYSGSPAERSGIKPGDIVTAVDGEDITGIGLMDVVLKVRGPKGSSVTVTVIDGETSAVKEVEMIRDEVHEKSVHFEMLGDYAHVAISRFGEKTDEELGEVLKEVASEQALGIILDLRYNPGGLLDSVVDSASRFLRDGVVFTVKYSDGREEVYKVREKDVVTDLPIVVLVNGFSASGSEVVAGALQDHDRALIAGATTFGKGSVNALTPIGADQGMYITIARWLTPDGHMIEGNGIEPDEQLSLVGGDMINWAIEHLDIVTKLAEVDR
ncbi:MAG: S41 family peptidase [Dehalococcoidales bacterium]|jgi:carboxyl-terminal processing protease|nr:S41 family peptidase [Dehalococcoidales bacterium]MDD3264725.1 S41 family peptidase [Dehalococcoidales bacterium]MDD4322555.1 S41 family peptidase [Dehalococcoidales bacterium]MDD4794319.1 S41 family peptidase [Dehalococcoidales bacterium]MDD5498337.1 S41 family peptidase [Dehalococcoidales bacterium]